MTRINVVPVAELCDKHLLAEYRELPRVFKLARECNEAPAQYTLGTGHVKFFFNKLSFLTERHKSIVKELTTRGFSIRYPEAPVSRLRQLYGSYTPTKEALAINRARIEERKSQFKRKEKLDA